MASIFGARAVIPQHTFLTDKSVTETSDDEAYEITDRASNDEIDAELKKRPELAHHLQNDSSILSLAVGDQFIYAGTQDGEIVVWSLASF
jgi:di- and tripeptidase